MTDREKPRKIRGPLLMKLVRHGRGLYARIDAFNVESLGLEPGMRLLARELEVI